jgi:hypothetical protein
MRVRVCVCVQVGMVGSNRAGEKEWEGEDGMALLSGPEMVKDFVEHDGKLRA